VTETGREGNSPRILQQNDFFYTFLSHRPSIHWHLYGTHTSITQLWRLWWRHIK